MTYAIFFFVTFVFVHFSYGERYTRLDPTTLLDFNFTQHYRQTWRIGYVFTKYIAIKRLIFLHLFDAFSRSYLEMQWAAVKMCRLFNKVPPQMNFPFRNIAAYIKYSQKLVKSIDEQLLLPTWIWAINFSIVRINCFLYMCKLRVNRRPTMLGQSPFTIFAPL